MAVGRADGLLGIRRLSEGRQRQKGGREYAALKNRNVFMAYLSLMGVNLSTVLGANGMPTAWPR